MISTGRNSIEHSYKDILNAIYTQHPSNFEDTEALILHLKGDASALIKVTPTI